MQLLYPLTAILAFIIQAHTATLPTYNVEAYFVVESSVIQRYKNELTTGTSEERDAQALANAQADIDYFLVEINEMFASMAEYGLNIEVRSRKLEFLDQNVLGSGSVDVEAGLDTFDDWLANQGTFASLGHDVAVLWTAAELTSYATGDGPTGYAHIDGVCTSTRGSTIVEFDGTYHGAVVTAHEIAHILGANHDSGSSGFLMSPTISPASQRRWSFSSGTATALKSAISQTSCLQNDNSASVALSGPPTEELLNPDVVCVRKMRSENTFMCKDPYFYGNDFPKGDTICQEIYCKDPTRPDYCLTVYPTDGMPCGTNLICNDGLCVADSSGNTADIDEDCIFDDQKEIRLDMGSSVFQGSCEAFIQQYGDNYCTQPALSEKCCGTCKRLNDNTGTDTGSTGTDTGSTGTDTGTFGTSNVRPSTGCAGDQYYDCGLYKSLVCNPANGLVEACCETCSSYSTVGKRSVDINVHSVANLLGRPGKPGTMIQVKELTNKKEEVVQQPIDEE